MRSQDRITGFGSHQEWLSFERTLYGCGRKTKEIKLKSWKLLRIMDRNYRRQIKKGKRTRELECCREWYHVAQLLINKYALKIYKPLINGSICDYGRGKISAFME